MNVKTVEGNLSNALKGLNVFQITAINKYISVKTELKISEAMHALQDEAEEKEKYLKSLNRKNWDKISDTLTIAMRKNHISDERIVRIYKSMLDISDLGIDNVNAESKNIKVLSIKDFEDLVELAIDTSCRNCQHNHKHCKAFYILKRYNAPKPSGYKAKCKYAYKGVE